jgi:hypothetical protein
MHVLTGPCGPLQEQARLQQAPGSLQSQGPPTARHVVKVDIRVVVLDCVVT